MGGDVMLSAAQHDYENFNAIRAETIAAGGKRLNQWVFRVSLTIRARGPV